MASNSMLIGFTLTNGATLFSSSVTTNKCGGGVYCPKITTTVISNCILVGNSAGSSGGGSYYGALRNCALIGNSAYSAGGGAYYGTLYNCTLASNRTYDAASGVGGAACGGASDLFMYNCVLSGNSSTYGGGTYFGFLYNCLLTGNRANGQGGGAFGGTLYNCTISDNAATGGSEGGGVFGANLRNSIIYYNTGPGPNWFWSSCTFINSCTTPSTNGWPVGNITNVPVFVARGSGNYRLAPTSPCINGGIFYDWMTNSADVRSRDLDGLPRIKYGAVDMGAYESIRSGTIYGFR